MGLKAQDIVDGYFAMKYVTAAPLEFSTYLSEMVHIDPGSLNQSPVTVGNSLLLANADAAVRRSPRSNRCELIGSKYLPATRDGAQTARDHKQGWCEMCKQYKAVQTMCKFHNVYLCRPGIKAKRDLYGRTCYDDHIKFGLPVGRGKYKIGRWSAKFDDLQASQKAWPAAKRRASGGMVVGIGAV